MSQHRAADGAAALTKLDLTLGVRPSDRGLVYGQLQIADSPDSDPTARLTATLVLEITKLAKAEFGILYGLENDTSAGVRSGVWFEF